jgi:hypothetical protein
VVTASSHDAAGVDAGTAWAFGPATGQQLYQLLAPGAQAGNSFGDSGAGGAFAVTVDLTNLPPGGQAAAAGERWYFLAWYRDANPQPTSNFTDGRVLLSR